MNPKFQVGVLFALSLIGYPLAGMLAAGLDLESTEASIPFRGLVIALSLWIAGKAVFSLQAHVTDRVLLAFWALYICRLVIDSAGGIPGANDALIYFIAIAATPAIALSTATSWWSERVTARVIFAIGVTICSSVLLLHAYGIAMDRSLTEITGRLSFDTVNPITFGHVAVTTLISVYCLRYGQGGSKQRVWLVIAAAIALGCLIMSASRGPLVALVACLLFVAASQRRWTLLIAFAITASLATLFSEESALFVRMQSIEEDRSSLERLVLQGNAIRQFIDSPLLGNAYTEAEFGIYPHNLFIETAMALGLIGILALVWLLLRTLGPIRQQVADRAMLLPLLFVQYLTAFQFSGSLWGSGPFWICTAVLLARRVQTNSSALSTAAQKAVA